ncbi:hypothetical protein IAU60_003521 [Kwoniella sp. DSM 27419]
MDEEASFANLLASTAQLSRPSWDPTPASGGGIGSDDPWANPFASNSPTAAITVNPFVSTGSTLPSFQPPSGSLDSPREEVSPYVQRLQEDADAGLGKAPDPPSVIAARERSLDSDEDGGFGQSSSFIGADAVGFGGDSHAYASSAFGTPAIDTSLTADPFASQPRDPAQVPFVPPDIAAAATPAEGLQPDPTQTPPKRGLPSSLIDEDLLAASDPEQSLKKAFVKSAPAPRTSNKEGPPSSKGPDEKKGYVFTPSKPAHVEKKPADVKHIVEDEVAKGVQVDAKKKESGEGVKSAQQPAKGPEEQHDHEEVTSHEPKAEAADESPKEQPSARSAEVAPEPATSEATAASVAGSADSGQADDETDPPKTPKVAAATPTAPRSPTSVPLPASAVPTPTVSRAQTPVPPQSAVESSGLATPSIDRVSVSPLDAPTIPQDQDYGFKSLSIGGSAMPPVSAPPVPVKETWASETTASPPKSRFAGKGWGVLDEEEDTGSLFGKGSIVSAKPDLWGQDATSSAVGWGEASVEESLAAGPSRYDQASMGSPTNSNAFASPSRRHTSLSSASADTSSPGGSTGNITPTASPRKKLSSIPVFQISVGDPTKVGDPVRGYTVYTVRTQTTSPHYRKGSFSVLRRFSDFLWLFEVLTANNPGVIVPPVPGKHTFGRFQDQFIETRRAALQRCLSKITNHPVLQLDPDLRMFLESDSFAYESKARRQDILAAEKQSASLLSGWTGPKFSEHDEWFESRQAFLNSLESQLKALSKSIETSSKHRLDLAQSIAEFGETVTALAESDLGSGLSSALAQLASVADKEKESGEEQAKEEVVTLLNMADEYIRFIGSVRLAFGGRVKAWTGWQNQEKEVTRLKGQREKARAQGKLGDNAQSSLAEIVEAERRARDQHSNFEHLSRLTKSEFVRFERERVEEFKVTLERYLEGMMEKEKELIGAWESLHRTLVKLVGAAGQGEQV